MRLILTAHGSVDPRSVATSHAVADRIRDLRPRLDVRVAFCEKSTPNLREVLAELDGPAVVTPLLLASAYHAGWTSRPSSPSPEQTWTRPKPSVKISAWFG